MPLPKKNIEEKTEQPPALLTACILLDKAEFDYQDMLNRLEAQWKIKAAPFMEHGNFCTVIEGMVVGCLFSPKPLAEPAVESNVKQNFMWPGGEEQVARQAAHIKVSLMRAKDPIAAHVVLTKVLGCMLNQENAIGVFFDPSVLEATYFVEHAGSLRSGKLPAELWVQIAAGESEGAYNFSTTGMRKFGKNECEILGTTTDFFQVYHNLLEIITYIIGNDVVFADGETIGSEESGLVKVTVSDGVLKDGVTTKFAL